MCLNPIKLINPASKISLNGGQRYYLEVPCGECAECREARRTDMYFRTYYECLDTWNANGYVYFDTLTYRSEDLPHISDYESSIEKGSKLDFSCFRKSDFRLFMVRLRRQLDYHGFDSKNNLKYFVATEYGSDKEYRDSQGRLRKGTERPHYHVLFFVKSMKLDPLTLSQYVYDCWQKGNTDGIPCKDVQYVLKHTFGPRFNSDLQHMQATCNYVAKYCLKDSEFEKKLKTRMEQIYGIGKFDTYTGKKRYRKLVSEMRCYTRWSKGFGEYGLQYNTEENLYNGVMEMPDSKKVHRFAPLSGYLNRKKYYETAYNSAGELYWKLTDEGRERALDKAIKSVEDFADRFKEWLMNADSLIEKGDIKYDFDGQEWKPMAVTTEDIYNFKKNTVCRAVELLGDRTPEDFAFYVLFYKGRIKGPMMYDPVEFFYRGLVSVDEIEDNFVWNYAHCKHKAHFDGAIVCEEKLHSSPMETYEGMKGLYEKFGWTFDEDYHKKFYKSCPGGYVKMGFEFGYDELCDVYKGDFVKKYNASHSTAAWTAEQFIDRYCINDTFDVRWKDFDLIYQIYSSSMVYQNRRKQNSYDYIEDMKRRFKSAGFFVKNI